MLPVSFDLREDSTLPPRTLVTSFRVARELRCQEFAVGFDLLFDETHSETLIRASSDVYLLFRKAMSNRKGSPG